MESTNDYSISLNELTKKPIPSLWNLNDMRLNAINTDVILLCKTTETQAHQLILTAASPYFKKMFQNDIKTDFSMKCINYMYIEDEVMNIVLDYIYLQSTDCVSECDFDELVRVHEVAQLFELSVLAERCWKLLTESLNCFNCLTIWDMIFLYDKRSNIEEILNFIAENLSKIVEQNEFFALDISRMKFLLEKFIEMDIPCEEALMGAVIEWINNDRDKRKALHDILLKLNYDFISKEYVEGVLKTETFFVEDIYLKKFFQLQLKPKLKTKLELEPFKSSKIVCPFSKKNNNALFKFAIFSYLHDDKKRYTLSMTDAWDMQSKETMIELPFQLPELVRCFQWKTVLYFLLQEIPTSKIQSLVAYDWKSQRIISENVLPEAVYVFGACITKNRAYIIGLPIRNAALDTLYIQLYVLDRNEFRTVKVPEPEEVVTCVNMNDTLYVLCKTDGMFFYYVLANNSLTAIETERFLLYGKRQLKEELITVYNNDLYCFSYESGQCICFLYKPHTSAWVRWSVKCAEWEPMKMCCTHETHGIVFYSARGNIFKYHFSEKVIKKLRDGTLKYQIKNDKFTRLSCNGSPEVLAIGV